MTVRRRIWLTHEGWYYVVVVSFIVIGAVWRQANLMIILAGLMIGPLLLSWRICVATMRRLQVVRRMPEHVHAGENFGVEIAVHNTRRRLSSWFVGVKDRVCYGGGDAQTHSSDVEVLLPQVLAGDWSKTCYRCALPQRGAYEFGPMTVFTRFPLGLIKCSRNVEGRAAVIVFPRLGRLTKRWSNLIQSRRAGLRRSLNRRAFTDGGDFFGVRDWQPGDSKRSIHWRITAKLGALAVREFEELDSVDLTLLLDLWQSDVDSDSESNLVELAVSFAATVVDEVCRQSGTRLRIVILGDDVWQYRGQTTPRLRLRVLQELASRQSSRNHDADSQLQTLAASSRSYDQVVVISTRSADQAGITADNPWSQRFARRQTWLDVGDPSLKRYFQPQMPESLPADATAPQDAKAKGNRSRRRTLSATSHADAGG